MKSIIRESGLSYCRKHSIDHGKLEERGKYTIDPHRIRAYFLKKNLRINQSFVFGEVTI